MLPFRKSPETPEEPAINSHEVALAALAVFHDAMVIMDRQTRTTQHSQLEAKRQNILRSYDATDRTVDRIATVGTLGLSKLIDRLF